MQDKLKELEKKYCVDWREFEIGELFEITPTKSYGMTNDELRKHIGETLVVSNTSYSNGTFMRSSLKPTEVANQITFSDTTTDEGVFFQPYEFIGYSHVQKMVPKFNEKMTVKIGQYFVSTIRATVRGKYNYGTKLNRANMAREKITLPTVNNGIAFSYIEEFIATMEAERLATLEAYLLATGLNDYELSEEEREVIGQFGNIEWHEFMNDELFEIFPSKSYSGLNDNQILKKNGKTPYVSNQSQDNGYIGWSNLEPLNEGGVITLSDTWQSERTIFYQPRPFIGKSHLQVMKPLMKEFDMYSAMFIISSFRKSILEMNYDYGTKFNRTKIKSTKIQLPVNDQEEPNFEFMTVLIKAMQKIVIKGVVEYLDKRIVATDEIINQ